MSQSLATPLRQKRRPNCLQKTLFNLERCSTVIIICARCLYSSDLCSLFSVTLMGPKIIVHPFPPSRRPCVLVLDLNAPRGHWPIGKVIKTYPDKHGVGCRVTVKKTLGEFKSLIKKTLLHFAGCSHEKEEEQKNVDAQ